MKIGPSLYPSRFLSLRKFFRTAKNVNLKFLRGGVEIVGCGIAYKIVVEQSGIYFTILSNLETILPRDLLLFEAP